MKKMLCIALATALPLGSTALAQTPEPKPRVPEMAAPAYTIKTADFVKQATASNQFEIQSSEIAQEKAAADDVKSFAAQMIKDHTKAGNDLKAALQKAGLEPGEAKLSPKQAKMIEQLKAASGEELQTLYIDMQAHAHMEAISLFRTYAGSGDDQAVVSFAKTTLPVLEKHLEHVKTLVAKP